MPTLTDTGKHGYDWREEFQRRTEEAIKQKRTDVGPLAGNAAMLVEGRYWAYDALLAQDELDVLMLTAPYLIARRGYRILDIGCGYGRHAPFLSMFDCAEYLGVDLVGARIAQAIARYKSPIISFREADATQAKIEKRFDVVWCCTVLQHLPRPEKLAVIETIKSALKPGGLVMLFEGRLTHGMDTEKYYSEDCPKHMIPIERDEVVAAFKPLEFVRPGKRAFYVAGGK